MVPVNFQLEGNCHIKLEGEESSIIDLILEENNLRKLQGILGGTSTDAFQNNLQHTGEVLAQTVLKGVFNMSDNDMLCVKNTVDILQKMVKICNISNNMLSKDEI